MKNKCSFFHSYSMMGRERDGLFHVVSPLVSIALNHILIEDALAFLLTYALG